MPEDVQSWICDQCGELIERPEDGWVEWKSVLDKENNRPKCYGLRIVHAAGSSPSGKSCQFEGVGGLLQEGEHVGDAALTEFLGGSGLMRMLEKLHEHALPEDEIIEFLKRTRVENYEFARRHLKDALAAGVIENDVAYGYWWPEDLKRVIDWVNGDDESDDGD